MMSCMWVRVSPETHDYSFTALMGLTERTNKHVDFVTCFVANDVFCFQDLGAWTGYIVLWYVSLFLVVH